MALKGKTVVLTRGPDRAESLLRALAARGSRGWLFPVIDFETPADTGPLDAALRALRQGSFDWLVVTSVTTVGALGVRAAALGVDTLVPPRTRVAAVGPAAARALEVEGINVDLVPAGEQSGQGLLRSWAAATGLVPNPIGPAAAVSDAAARDTAAPHAAEAGHAPVVLLPQADIADPALREGLRRLGAKVTAVAAYRTVAYPAAAERRLLEPAPFEGAMTGPNAPVILTPADFRRRHSAGEVDALVLTSPSAARRVHAEAGTLAGSLKVVTIGGPTAEEADALGLRVAAVASEPTPEGIMGALEQALCGVAARPEQ